MNRTRVAVLMLALLPLALMPLGLAGGPHTSDAPSAHLHPLDISVPVLQGHGWSTNGASAKSQSIGFSPHASGELLVVIVSANDFQDTDPITADSVQSVPSLTWTETTRVTASSSGSYYFSTGVWSAKTTGTTAMTVWGNISDVSVSGDELTVGWFDFSGADHIQTTLGSAHGSSGTSTSTSLTAVHGVDYPLISTVWLDNVGSSACAAATSTSPTATFSFSGGGNGDSIIFTCDSGYTTGYASASNPTVSETFSTSNDPFSMVLLYVDPNGPSAPGTPTGLSSTGQTGTTVSLSWTNPTGGGLVNDTVYYKLGASCAGTLSAASTAGAATTYTVTGLAIGTQYSFDVRAWNATGQGAASTCVTQATLPLPGPVNALTAANVTAVALNLTWVNPTGGGLVNDTVYRWVGAACVGTANATSTAGVATAKRVTSLAPSTTYAFEVRAWNATGQGAAGTCVNVTTLALPVVIGAATFPLFVLIGLVVFIWFLLVAWAYTRGRDT